MTVSVAAVRFRDRFRPKQSTLALLLGVAFLVLAFCTMFMYVKMREVTSSVSRFQGVPCYITALQLFICGMIVLLLSKWQFNSQLTALRFAGAIFGVSLCLCVIAIVMTFWLAEKHDSMSYCVYNPDRRTCACRADRRAQSTNGWTIYETVAGCRSLDVLFRLMVISMIIYAVSAFCSALALIFVYSLAMDADRQRHNLVSSTIGHHRVSPFGGEWDSWARGSAHFHRMMAVLRNGWLPPSYEASQRHSSVCCRPSNNNYGPSSPSPTDYGPNNYPQAPNSGAGGVFSLNIDPPPPYSTPPQLRTVAMPANNHSAEHNSQRTSVSTELNPGQHNANSEADQLSVTSSNSTASTDKHLGSAANHTDSQSKNNQL